MPEVLLDAAGRPRSPATVPGYHARRSRRNKGQRYPADPPTVTEIVAVSDTPTPACMEHDCAPLLSCCGARACASTRLSRSANRPRSASRLAACAPRQRRPAP
jgi:hypothetical protein